MYTSLLTFRLVWLSTIISIIMSASLFSQFAGGTGTQNDPFQLATAVQLDSVRNHLNSFYKQIADIELGIVPYNSQGGWQPIGFKRETYAQPFTGSLDGNGYSIRNLRINRPDSVMQGLFGYVNHGKLTHVKLVNVNVIGGNKTGGLAGQIENNCQITFCNVSGNIDGGDLTGGLFGDAYDYPLIADCQSDCVINGHGAVGGLTGGAQMHANIYRCKSTGSVEGYSYAGGLIGYAPYEGNIRDCYSRSVVIGDFSVGGLIGTWGGDEIRNCYSTGQLLFNLSGGGLIGYGVISRNVINSYWDMETSGTLISMLGEGRNTSDMQCPYSDSTYTDWDFTDTWFSDTSGVINDGYPCLRSIQFTEDVDEIETNPIISMCNYPNPFKASATIAFSVAKAGKAKVEIYNIKGQRVKTLLCNAKSTGQNKLVWDGCNDEGKPVSSGMYFYRLEAPGYTKTQKMLYLK